MGNDREGSPARDLGAQRRREVRRRLAREYDPVHGRHVAGNDRRIKGRTRRSAPVPRLRPGYPAAARETAWRPFWVSTTRMVMRWPSARPLSPARSTTEIWTKTSFPPSSTSTNPMPLTVLYHLTVPAISVAVDMSGARLGACEGVNDGAREGGAAVPSPSEMIERTLVIWIISEGDG